MTGFHPNLARSWIDDRCNFYTARGRWDEIAGAEPDGIDAGTLRGRAAVPIATGFQRAGDGVTWSFSWSPRLAFRGGLRSAVMTVIGRTLQPATRAAIGARRDVNRPAIESQDRHRRAALHADRPADVPERKRRRASPRCRRRAGSQTGNAAGNPLVGRLGMRLVIGAPSKSTYGGWSGAWPTESRQVRHRGSRHIPPELAN